MPSFRRYFVSGFKSVVTASLGSTSKTATPPPLLPPIALDDNDDEAKDDDDSQEELRSTEQVKADDDDPFALIRHNLPPSVLVCTPFGMKRVVYADYTASGRSLRCIEDYMQTMVHPLFANTHTESSATGLQTNAYREEARQMVMQAINARSEDHALIFTGSGATAAIAKLIAILGIKLPAQLVPYLDGKLPTADRPLVLISSQEHHSNELLWRETNTCDVVVVPALELEGSVDIEALESLLQQNHRHRRLVIGSFSAGSNVTGIRNDVGKITALLHQFGGYACFDYAGAGPYVRIDMQHDGMDAVFLSPHKFVGGPGTPGLLCLRNSFYDCRGASKLPPSVPGGGTVRMVWGGLDGIAPGVVYEDDNVSAREESGTPAILESIRCGLVFALQAQVGGPRAIEERESSLAKRAIDRFQRHGGILIMGSQYTAAMQSPSRLSITSFNIQCNGGQQQHGVLRLNHHFVTTVLNDLYGIQSRSGCSCAAPYGLRLFGVKEDTIKELTQLITSGITGANLGWARVNFNYFIDDDEFDFLCTAVEQIADHGWKLLPLYSVCMRTGMWVYTGGDDGKALFQRHAGVQSLKAFRLGGGSTAPSLVRGTQSFADILREAMDTYDRAAHMVQHLPGRFQCRDYVEPELAFTPQTAHLRFYALPSEAVRALQQQQQ